LHNVLIVSDNTSVRAEIAELISEEDELNISYLSGLPDLKNIKNEYNYLFILINNLRIDVPRIFANLTENFPATPIVFYNHSLFSGQYNGNSRISNVHLIIGEDRQQHLKKLIQQLKNSSWRKLPLEDFNISEKKLSPRIRKAIQFIEQNRLDACTLEILSSHLGISPGYFGQEFKKETGYSFRSFIQRVLIYYEDEVFINMNLSAVNMARLLGYSDLSSFSRSFKKRRGMSPTNFRRMSQKTS